MKRLRLIAPLLAATTLVAGACSSGASSGGSAGGKVTVNFWVFEEGGIGSFLVNLKKGFEAKYKNVDLAISKAFAVKEGYQGELRFDLINAFNWMNPSDPNTTLTYNYNTGAQTNSNFGQITSQAGLPATGQQRVIVASLKFRF